jgi:hypothetical protein
VEWSTDPPLFTKGETAIEALKAALDGDVDAPETSEPESAPTETSEPESAPTRSGE